MSLSVVHLKRYREIVSLLWKYGRSDLVQEIRRSQDFDPDWTPATPAEQSASPEQLADDLEAMGPAYVKLGQLLAGRPDLVPAPYRRALARLQDSVKPFPFADVERIVVAELGVRISKAFSRFDPEPIAAASLGQVHAAALRDGREVVVKVQRPDIPRQIADDFVVLSQIAGWLDAYTDLGRRMRFQSVVEEFRVTLQHELDYLSERQNLLVVGRNLREFDLIRVPRPISDYCSRLVLTMERIDGQKITRLSAYAQLDFKGGPLAEALFRAYLKQVLIDGIFHADPHPGNVFITREGRVALLDLGMVGHTGPGLQDRLLKLLLALGESDGEEAAEIVIAFSERLETANLTGFRQQVARLVGQSRGQGLRQLQVGQTLLEVSASARDHGLFVPSELVLLGKTLLQLDEVGRVLDPEFDPAASIRRNVDSLAVERMRKGVSKAGAVSALIDTKAFVGKLPWRLNRIMDALTTGDLEIKVKAVDAKTVLDGMEKIANRITAGTILAALIIGAALLMRVQTRFQLFGYPGLAIVCFLLALAGALWLVVGIFIHDHRQRNKPSP